MRVGIFGGTFNPPHKTHISVAQKAKEQLRLDRLIVFPCGIPPHKRCDVDARTRLTLTRLAFSDFAEVSDFEISKEGKSYTVETLRFVKNQYPDAELFLVVGGDSFASFDKWYCPQEIAKLATLAVAERSRKTHERTAKRIFQKTGAKAVFLDVAPNGVSSTEIRLRYQLGLDNSSLVSAQVNDFILQNGLYAKYLPVAQKLKSYLSEKRFMHTFYVVKRGLELAEEGERDKVFLACLLHDCAKYVPEEKFASYGFSKPVDMPDPVVHSFLGEKVAEKDFGVTDREILDAIAYHTTGCPNMTRLQKIVYIADKTEETRPYPLSHLKRGSLDAQLKACLAEANSYKIAHHGTEVYQLSQQTLDFYFPKSTN